MLLFILQLILSLLPSNSNLNTSHVTVYLYFTINITFTYVYLNTSHVTVYQGQKTI